MVLTVIWNIRTFYLTNSNKRDQVILEKGFHFVLAIKNITVNKKCKILKNQNIIVLYEYHFFYHLNTFRLSIE